MSERPISSESGIKGSRSATGAVATTKDGRSMQGPERWCEPHPNKRELRQLKAEGKEWIPPAQREKPPPKPVVNATALETQQKQIDELKELILMLAAKIDQKA